MRKVLDWIRLCLIAVIAMLFWQVAIGFGAVLGVLVGKRRQ